MSNMFIFIYRKGLDVNIWDAKKCFQLWTTKNVSFFYYWISINFLCFIKRFRQWTFLQFICRGVDLYFVNCIIDMITLINCTTLCYFYDFLSNEIMIHCKVQALLLKLKITKFVSIVTLCEVILILIPC